MNVKPIFKWGIFVVLALVLTTGLASADAAGTRALSSGFTYQGQLTSSAAPYTGSCDFQFKLYDAQAGGAQVGTTQNKTGVLLNEGYFTVVLDFGPTAFNGQARWLEINVRCPAGGGSYTVLAPRQALTAAPYAWFAQGAGSALLAETVPWDGILGVPPEVFQDTQYSAGSGLSLTGTTFSADTSYLQRRVTATCAAGSSIRVINADGTVTCQTDQDTQYSAGTGLTLTGSTFSADTSYLQRRVSSTCPAGSAIRVVNANGTVTCQSLSDGWGLTGNAGTDPATNYLGTSDNVALELRVNGLRALRLEPHANSPNLVGGRSNNSVTPGVHGAVIGGGGGPDPWAPNTITDHYGVIGGGYGNQAGNNNTDLEDAQYATVGGGSNNTASGFVSTVPGGIDNTAEGTYSLAAGTRAKAYEDGCFVWGDSTWADIECYVPNRWVARASGGVYFYTNATQSSGMYLSSGGNSWNAVSNRDLKDNFTPIDTSALLEALAQYPITTWNYKSQDDSILHIGMMADEFNSLIDGLGGEGEDFINTMDAVGVSLAAVQGLYAENQDLRARVDDLEARLDALEAGQTSGASAASLPLSWLMGLGLAAVAGVFFLRRPRGGA